MSVENDTKAEDVKKPKAYTPPQKTSFWEDVLEFLSFMWLFDAIGSMFD